MDLKSICYSTENYSFYLCSAHKTCPFRDTDAGTGATRTRKFKEA